MANVFVSYSAGDREYAAAVSAFIENEITPGNGVGHRHKAWYYEDVQNGTPVGSLWRDTLFERLRWADAVVCLLSDNYNTSLWCAAEIATALTLGCDILPVRVRSAAAEHSMLVAYSYADWLGDEATAKGRLKQRLLDIDAMGGLASWTGEWPYPGLRPFERRDASVYFGRKQELLEIVALLQSPKQQFDPEIITIVGPSGCGKSSLARAAIIPYLAGRGKSWIASADPPLGSARDGLGKKRMWLPVRPFVPGVDPLEGLGNALAGSVQDYRLDVDVGQVRREVRTSLSVCAATLLDAAQVEDDCRLLLVVDQLEQLFSVAGQDHRQAFVTAVKPALLASGRVRALATMRPEFLDRTFTDGAFSTLKTRVYPLAPLDDKQLADIIEQPADKAHLTIEPGLVTRMVRETAGGANLALLALTLHRLKDFRHLGEDDYDLSEEGYERSGGIRQALSTQADEALREARDEAGLTDDAPVIETLMELIGVRGATPTRKAVAKSTFSDRQQTMLDQFERRRLISYDTPANAAPTVSITHDLLIEKWDKLADEFRRRRAFLQALEPIDADAQTWAAEGRPPGRLLRGEDLVAAMSSLEVHDTRRFRVPWLRYRPGMVNDNRIKALSSQFLRASVRAENRNHRRWAMAIAFVVILVGAAVNSVWIEKKQADAALHQETITRLIAEGEGMISQNNPDGTVRGLQQLLTANMLSQGDERAALFSPVIQLSKTVKIFQTDEKMRTVALSPDASLAAGGGAGGHVWIWRVDTGAAMPNQPLSVGKTEATAVRFSGDGSELVAVGKDGGVHVWDVASGRVSGGLPTPGGELTAVATGPEGRQVAYGYRNGTIEIMDTSGTDTRSQASIRSGVGEVTALAFSPDGTRVVAGGKGTAQVWQPASRRLEPLLKFERPWPVWSVAYNAQGRLAAAGWGDGGSTIVLRNADGAITEINCATCQQPGVQSLDFDPTGTNLVSGGVRNTVQLWDAANGTAVDFAMGGHTDDVRSVAFSADGKRIVSGSDDHTVRVWVAPTVARSFENLAGYADAKIDGGVVALSPDASRVAAADDSGAFRVWYSESGRQVPGATSGHRRLTGIAFSDAGDVATVSDDGVVQLWSAGTRYQQPTEVGRLDEAGHSVALSRDGRRVAAGGDRHLTIWTPGADRPATPIDVGDKVTGLMFSRDGGLLAYGTGGGKVQAFDVATGKTAFPTPQVGDGGDGDRRTTVAAVAFSPDGTKLAAAAMGDDRVRVWDLKTANGFQMQGHEIDVVSVRFTEDSRYVVSGAKDDTVQLWDARTGARLGQPLFDKHGNVTAVGVTPDDMNIVSTRRDGSVTTWPGPAKWQSLLCSKLTYNMNHAQWQQWVELPDDQFRAACDGLPEVPGWPTP